MGANPIRQIEEAIFLLRRQDMRGWSQYLLAAVPQLLTLLAFVRDMSAYYFGQRCAFESLLCALVYFWASVWKARFGGRLLATMNGPGLPSPQAGFWHTLVLQSVLQTLKLVALPFAVISIFPIAWTSSFFRNAAIEASFPESTLRSVLGKSARRATANTRGNWVGFAILMVMLVVVLLNVYILVGLLPFLVRMFSGAETMFTRDIRNIFSFNIFCIVVAVTWFIIDPVILAYGVVRSFYAEARTDGRDLLAQLRPVAALALLFFALIPVSRLAAQDTGTVSTESISRAVKQTTKSDDYQWLRTRRIEKDTEDTFAARLNRDIRAIFDKVGSWFKSIGDWFRRIFEKTKVDDVKAPDIRTAGGDVRWLLYGLGALVLIAALVVVWRSRSKDEEPSIIASSLAATPDLSKENVLASDLPEEEWLRMARELLAQGELRLAVRALYLSNLSFLGSRQFIHIARAKTNAIYERELRLRPRGSEVSAPFAQANRSFERAWYGFHEVTPEFVAVFQQDVEAIRQHAKA